VIDVIHYITRIVDCHRKVHINKFPVCKNGLNHNKTKLATKHHQYNRYITKPNITIFSSSSTLFLSAKFHIQWVKLYLDINLKKYFLSFVYYIWYGFLIQWSLRRNHYQNIWKIGMECMDKVCVRCIRVRTEMCIKVYGMSSGEKNKWFLSYSHQMLYERNHLFVPTTHHIYLYHR
jgi:hypothetical protein